MPGRASRLKVRRNGLAGQGKLLIMPSSFDELLEECSRKFSEGTNAFKATRIFTDDGFEVDQEGFEAIADGDILVVSAGEPFMDALEQSHATSTGSLCSIAAPPSDSLTSPTNPNRGSPILAAVSMDPPAPAPPNSVATPPLHQPSTPHSHTHLTVLQSAPLISRDPVDASRVKPLQQLDIEKEREEVCDPRRLPPSMPLKASQPSLA